MAREQFESLVRQLEGVEGMVDDVGFWHQIVQSFHTLKAEAKQPDSDLTVAEIEAAEQRFLGRNAHGLAQRGEVHFQKTMQEMLRGE
ncbi:MAG TPA: hypothetical protein VLH19_00535 [Patescibacteria group bacterium]|nr:hypothetical protein [Patescibacteria group bacterium]